MPIYILLSTKFILTISLVVNFFKISKFSLVRNNFIFFKDFKSILNCIKSLTKVNISFESIFIALNDLIISSSDNFLLFFFISSFSLFSSIWSVVLSVVVISVSLFSILF